MKLWPGVSHIDIINYFVFSEGGDREEMRNYKSTEAFNYFHSNKVGRIFLCKHEDYVFLKAEVDRSQSANHKVSLGYAAAVGVDRDCRVLMYGWIREIVQSCRSNPLEGMKKKKNPLFICELIKVT